jgi:hypothetical protein
MQLKLYVSGETINSSNIVNPMIVFANYVVDSLLTDAFSIGMQASTHLHILCLSLCLSLSLCPCV